MAQLLHNIATSISALNDLTSQVEIANVLTSTIDIVVDAENKAIVEDLTIELQLALKENDTAVRALQHLQQDRHIYAKEASALRDQFVLDYRQMLGQLDESRRLQLMATAAANSTPSMSTGPNSSLQQQQQQQLLLQQQQQPPPPPYHSARTLDMATPVAPSIRSSPLPPQLPQPPQPPPDIAFRRIMLAPHENPGRVVKKVLSYFDATDIYALSDASKFYSHLINWIFEEISTPPLLVDVVTPSQQQQQQQQQQTPQQLLSPPPPQAAAPPPPPYTPLQTQRTPTPLPNSASSNTSRSTNRMKKAEQLSRSMSRREMKEITKLGARCKLLEKKVIILQNEKDDLLSQTDASANVKQFLLDKIKKLESTVGRLQSQTDNDQQIITFLDDSIEKKERERKEWMIERDAFETEKLKWSEAILVRDKRETELKSQKKVLVNEVKRMRRERTASSGSVQ